MVREDKDRELNIAEDIQKLICDLNNVSNEFNSVLQKYSKDFSMADKKQQDILHYIEFKNVSSVGGYRLIKELQKVRRERRIAEDNVDLLNRIGMKLLLNSKKDVVAEAVNSKSKNIKTRKYHTRYYSESSLNNIENKKMEV